MKIYFLLKESDIDNKKNNFNEAECDHRQHGWPKLEPVIS